MEGPPPCQAEGRDIRRSSWKRGNRNCSGLRGNEQLAAFQEGVQAPGPPGPEEGRQGHFAFRSRFRTGAAADFTADHQVAQAPFCGVVVRWRLGVRYEDEQFLDVPFYPPAQLPLRRRRVFQERTAQRQQPLLQDQLPA